MLNSCYKISIQTPVAVGSRLDSIDRVQSKIYSQIELHCTIYSPIELIFPDQDIILYSGPIAMHSGI